MNIILLCIVVLMLIEHHMLFDNLIYIHLIYSFKFIKYIIYNSIMDEENILCKSIIKKNIYTIINNNRRYYSNYKN